MSYLNLIRFLSAISVFFIVDSSHCTAQSYISDTAVSKTAAVIRYDSALHEQRPVFSGKEYLRYPFPISSGSLYFKSENVVLGNVFYAGRYFTSIPLLYDQLNDELITRDISGYRLLRMFGPKVTTFTIHDARFIRIGDFLKSVQPGFWQVLHEKSVTVLEKENKKIVEIIQMGEPLTFRVESRFAYCIKRNEVYTPVNKRDDLLEVFMDRKEEVRLFLRKNKRKFRKLRLGEVILRVADHHHSLIAAQ